MILVEGETSPVYSTNLLWGKKFENGASSSRSFWRKKSKKDLFPIPGDKVVSERIRKPNRVALNPQKQQTTISRIYEESRVEKLSVKLGGKLGMIGYLARKGFSRLAELELIQTEYNMKLVVPNWSNRDVCIVPDTNLFSFVKIP